MKVSSFRRHIGRLLAGCSLIVLAGALAAVRAEAPSDSTKLARSQWQMACRQIIAGRIGAGARAIRGLVADRTVRSDLARVRKWLADYEKLQEKRDEFRQADHEYEIALAKESVKKGEWLAAMRHVASAYDTAKDPNAFAKDPWTTRVVDQAKKKAERLRKKGEWADTAVIYACLEHLYKNNAEYKKNKRRCLRHARLEVVYKKENQAKWQKDLERITRDMVRDAFSQVGRHYVRKADFKKALAGGIENLLILAKTTSLARTFPQLGNPDDVTRFTGEMTTLSHRIEEKDEPDAGEAYGRFEEILKINARCLALPEALIISEFMDGALYPLDHFSNMVWPSDVDEFKKHTMGRFQGVGIQIRKRKDGKLLVVTPLPDTPAYHAGIKPGDVVLGVNGEDITALEIDEIVPKIMGRKGTKVKLTIQRGDKKPFDVSIERDVIIITSVRGFSRDAEGKWDYMIDPEQRIGYIRIDPSFMDSTVEQMKDALDILNKQGARALILDLRFNPGGLLRTAIDVTDLFLPPGKGIVSTRGHHSDPWPAKSRSPVSFAKDMIVLVNETSASASEILAGALQDDQRAIVLGMRTHGKGSVQNLIPLADESAYLKLTTALYYLPSNRCPDRKPEAKTWGITPDILVSLRPEEKIKVIQMRRDSDILGSSEADPTSRPATTEPATQAAAPVSQPTTTPAPPPVEDRPNIDPQIEAALLMLRVKLLSGESWTWADHGAPPPAGKTAQAS